LLCFVLFSGLNWKLIQNIRIRPENTLRMIKNWLSIIDRSKKIVHANNRSSGVGQHQNRSSENRSIDFEAINQLRIFSKEPRTTSTLFCAIQIDSFSAVHRGCRHPFCAAKINLWWYFVNPILYIYDMSVRDSFYAFFWGFDFLKCISSLFSYFLVSFDATLWAKIQRASFLCYSSCFYILV
jgi:hypothetical protein